MRKRQDHADWYAWTIFGVGEGEVDVLLWVLTEFIRDSAERRLCMLNSLSRFLQNTVDAVCGDICRHPKVSHVWVSLQLLLVFWLSVDWPYGHVYDTGLCNIKSVLFCRMRNNRRRGGIARPDTPINVSLDRGLPSNIYVSMIDTTG